MASACVNNIGVSPESFLDCPPATFPPYGWLSPRISFSRDDAKITMPEASDLFKDAGDFEFRLEDPVMMLPADELFSDGKLMPLQFTADRSAPAEEALVRLPEAKKSGPGNEISDPYLFSPKAPRCSSHWRELLGLRKLHHKAALAAGASSVSNANTTSSSTSSSTTTGKSIRHFLHRNSKSAPSASDSSLNLPLLKDSDSDSLSFSSSRLSLSSSSSSNHDHDDLPRLSLDAADIRSSLSRPQRPRMRTAKSRMVAADNPPPLIDHPSAPATITRGVSLDSPRLSSSGKIVFHGLERSSSSPSTFNGGPRHKHRPGMERSYSANVRVTPVLNVPLCKSGVFGLFSSQSQKKEVSNGSTSTGTGSSKSHHHLHHHHHHYSSTGRTRREREG